MTDTSKPQSRSLTRSEATYAASAKLSSAVIVLVVLGVAAPLATYLLSNPLVESKDTPTEVEGIISKNNRINKTL